MTIQDDFEEISNYEELNALSELYYKDIQENTHVNLLCSPLLDKQANTPTNEFQVVKDDRLALFRALYDRGLISKSRANDILNCGRMREKDEVVKIDDSGGLSISYLDCHSPLCPTCMEKRRKQYFAKYIHVLKQFNRPKLLTITFKNVEVITRDYQKKCAIQAGRVQEYLSRAGYPIEMGIRVKEITRRNEGQVYKFWDNKLGKWRKGITRGSGWHIHYHYIVSSVGGKFIPVNEVSLALKKATKGESFIVDIRSASNDRGMMRSRDTLAYCLKYLCKAPHSLSVSDSVDYFLASSTTHFFQPVGSWSSKANKKDFSLYQKIMVLSEVPYTKKCSLVKAGNYIKDFVFWDDIKWRYIKDHRLSLEENLILNAKTIGGTITWQQNQQRIS